MWSDIAADVFVLQLLVAGTMCFVNVAHEPGKNLQGKATMSESPRTTAWSADKVVDGNTDQTATGGSCAIMDFSKNYQSVWLKVQLERPFNVAYIEIYFRNENTLYRMSGFSIYALKEETFHFASLDPNNLVYQHEPQSGCVPPIQKININRVARQIVFINQRYQGFQSSCTGNSSPYTGVEICEIQIIGCDQDRYSQGCGFFCSGDCKDQHCDAFNGSCIYGCTDSNVNTLDCKECTEGTYVSNKMCQKCPAYCQNDEFCNKVTGKCDNGCKNYWTGLFCNQCSDHYYGRDCNTPCGNCKNNTVCDKENGHCPSGCQNNWEREKCDADGFSKQALIVIAILSVLLGVSFIVVFIVVFYLKRVVTINTRDRGRSRGQTEIIQSEDQASQQIYDNLTSVSEDMHHYISLESVTREFPQRCMPSS